MVWAASGSYCFSVVRQFFFEKGKPKGNAMEET
jgi:hypothetical protein